MSQKHAAKLPTLDECRDGCRNYARNEATAKIMQGYWLSQAQQHLAIPHALKSAAGGKSQAIAKFANASPDAPDGFVAWLKDAASVGERTAYNYMTAAAAAGLTLEMNEAEALEAAIKFVDAKSAEAGWTFSALYAPKPESEPEPKKPKTKMQMKLEQRAEAWRVHLTAIKNLVNVKEFTNAMPALDDDELEELEEYTGQLADVIREAKAAKALAAGKGRGRK